MATLVIATTTVCNLNLLLIIDELQAWYWAWI